MYFLNLSYPFEWRHARLEFKIPTAPARAKRRHCLSCLPRALHGPFFPDKETQDARKSRQQQEQRQHPLLYHDALCCSCQEQEQQRDGGAAQQQRSLSDQSKTAGILSLQEEAGEGQNSKRPGIDCRRPGGQSSSTDGLNRELERRTKRNDDG